MPKLDVLPDVSRLSETIDRLMEEERKDEPRAYLGISSIGEPCDRKLWLDFRWARRGAFSGRILRLFERGKLEELTLTAYLSMAGLELEHILDDQLECDFGAHVKGHPDGIVRSGVPEAAKTVHVLEMKTHNRDSFNELAKKGVREAKPMHWAQMQCEMLGASMTLGEKVERALYVAVCKDDDRLHIERVRFEKEAAERLIQKGKRIATEDRVPPRVSDRPEWYQCRMCPFHPFCHEKAVPDVNCRTCGFFTSRNDGTCFCEQWRSVIPVEQQRKAQPCHVFNPDLVPWRVYPTADASGVVYEHPVLGTIKNGGKGGYDSLTLKAMAEGKKDFDTAQDIPF